MDELTLEPVTAAHHDFLLGLYASTRADEMALVPWSDQQKQMFVRQQFEAQDREYRQRHPAGSFLVVKWAGQPAGRLSVSRLATEIRVVDIAVLPAFRGRGIATALLAKVIADADDAGLPVTLHVEPWNPARRLYARLGFLEVAATDVHILCERPASARVS